MHKDTIMSNLDYKRSIWVEEEQLGKDKIIIYKKKRIKFKIPQEIKRKVVLRLRGLGKTKDDKIGNLLLYIWLNKGDDIKKTLWLSETSAKNGATKKLRLFEDKRAETFIEVFKNFITRLGYKNKIHVFVPKGSHNGSVLRLKGLGEKLSFRWDVPLLHRQRGDLLIELCVYSDDIMPNYRSFEMLNTDDIALEGWIYQKIDEIIGKLGKSTFWLNTFNADRVADLFNEKGWPSIFHALVNRLRLANFNVGVTESSLISLPGKCEKNSILRDNDPDSRYYYKITINQKFLSDPFAITAILSHELCHIIYSENFEDLILGYGLTTQERTLKEEYMVDILVFMFRLGEFQLRVSRDKRLTFGYFNQEIFERIQVIVSKKCKLF